MTVELRQGKISEIKLRQERNDKCVPKEENVKSLFIWVREIGSHVRNFGLQIQLGGLKPHQEGGV